jgi:tripartite ATP-independent transporter DctM subunit
VEEAVPLRELPGVTWRALPALMMPVVLLGGIYGGVMTPTEAAAVAAGYALLAGWLLRSIALRDVWDALRSSARSTASVGVLIAGALVFNYVVTRENIPDAISVWLQGFQLTQVQFLLLINVLLLVLGCLLDASTILLVIVPILIPAAQAMGVDLVHFGLVVVMNLMIGLITPPYGILLFVMAGLTRSSLLDIVRDLLPFLVALIGALFFLTFVPDLVLWLPRLFGYGG